MDPVFGRLKLGTSLLAMADLALPRECCVCGRTLLLHERHICTTCLSKLPETHFFLLEHNPMADKFNAAIASGCDVYEPYSRAAALFFYNSSSNYRKIPQLLKYGRNFSEGKYFASMLGGRLAQSPIFADVDTVIPVPLHWARRLSRGYNQAEVIARAVAAALPGAEIRTDILRRSRSTRTQTRLSVEEKKSNVEGAFRAKDKAAAAKHILLVDDVFTTGSTLSECHRALRAVYPYPDVRISVATLSSVK